MAGSSLSHPCRLLVKRGAGKGAAVVSAATTVVAGQRTVCWQGLSSRSSAGASSGCSGANAMAVSGSIIGQSGGQGSHIAATAKVGPPTITSMIVATNAKMTDHLCSAPAPCPLKMNASEEARKVTLNAGFEIIAPTPGPGIPARQRGRAPQTHPRFPGEGSS